MSQAQETLDSASTPLATIRNIVDQMHESEIRRFLHHFLFAGDEVFVPIEQLSFGERSRLMLAQLVAKGCNLLLLDEPVNHMDLTSRERFEVALTQFSGTILAAVHDRAFIKRLATATWTVAGGGVQEKLL
jgi:ATP-binding cassette subfamily F protein 3